MGVTSWALYNASRNIRRKGDPTTTNRYFRYRLYAQAFTIVAMVGGSFYYNADRFKRAEFRKLKKKKQEQEKREKWIRELEIRDEEDKEWRARLGVIRNAEREAEELRMVEEQRARRRAEEEKARGQNDDNRSVIEAIRLKNNASRANQSGEGEPTPVTDAVRQIPQTPPSPPKKEVEGDRHREDEGEYKPVLGETEAGGIFGIGHLKSLYAHLTRDRNDGDKKNAE